MPGPLAKGKLETTEGRHKIDIDFGFNPKELTFSKQNSWNVPDSRKGRESARLEFGGGQPKQLTMQLTFDTYEGDKSKDVRRVYTDKLLKMMAIDESLKDNRTGKGRPPQLKLVWGLLWSFKCVIESLTLKFTLFKSDGIPVRAVADLTLKQADDETELAKQNPSSGGRPGTRAWIVQSGDRLDWIAFKTLGDPGLWRFIADENRLLEPRALDPGLVLVIPPYA